MNPVPQALHDVLAVVLPPLREHCRDAWVVIGSAAVALAGAPVGTDGDTLPKPVPNKRIACPAAAGLSCELIE